MADNIILIGFMGVGKGTVARELGQRSGRFVVDSDDLIESMQNQKISQIFKKKGEKHFRKLEARCAQWLQDSVQNTVVSTGGGFHTVPNLAKLGTVVYLKADFDWIYKRVTQAKNASKKLKKRPLFNSYDETKKLYQSRQEAYGKAADVVVRVDKLDSEGVVALLQRL